MLKGYILFSGRGENSKYSLVHWQVPYDWICNLCYCVLL